jgi:GGDEF domain-containing protein
VRLTISIGFHLGMPNNGDAKSFLNALIDESDKALYIAKKKGKNRVESMI